MSNQMKALMMLANHPRLEHILAPAIDVKREEFHWRKINYGVLSGGQKVALSWAYCIWEDKQIPEWNESDAKEKFALRDGVRDPIAAFGVLDRELQVLMLQALLVRHA